MWRGFFPFATRTVSSMLLAINPELEQSARASGAGWLQTMRYVLVPLLAPAIVAAWLMLFVIFIRELGATILLYAQGTETISVSLVVFERAQLRLCGGACRDPVDVATHSLLIVQSDACFAHSDLRGTRVAFVRVKELRKLFGELVAVECVSFAVEAGHTLALLGPSGCGKTHDSAVPCRPGGTPTPGRSRSQAPRYSTGPPA